MESLVMPEKCMWVSGAAAKSVGEWGQGGEKAGQVSRARW